jgi:hypothetical protein
VGEGRHRDTERLRRKGLSCECQESGQGVKKTRKGKKLGDELQIEKGVGPRGKRRFGMGGGAGGGKDGGWLAEGWGGGVSRETDGEDR